jgi:hypothetical protein
MTSNQAQAYAVIALNELILAGVIKVEDKNEVLRRMEKEMFVVIHSIREQEAERKAENILQKKFCN